MDISDNSCEAMDVDQSIHSIQNMDNSSVDETNTVLPLINIKQEPLDDDKNLLPKQWKVKKFHINLINKKPKSFIQSQYVAQSMIILVLAVIVYCFNNINCIDGIQIDEIHDSLTKKLYGQDDAVEKIIKTLNMDTKSKVLFFYGGTGVGKTFAGSLILNSVLAYSNVYHFTMPSFRENFSTNLLLGLIMCKSSIILVDGLNSDDMDIKTHIEDVIEKSENLNKNINIILIYNCDIVNSGFQRQCDTFFANKLEDNFKGLKVYKEYVKFEPLREEHLLKCIEAEVGPRKIKQLNMQQILKNFDVTSDGCKGVHTKMKLLNVP